MIHLSHHQRLALIDLRMRGEQAVMNASNSSSRLAYLKLFNEVVDGVVLNSRYRSLNG